MELQLLPLRSRTWGPQKIFLNNLIWTLFQGKCSLFWSHRTEGDSCSTRKGFHVSTSVFVSMVYFWLDYKSITNNLTTKLPVGSCGKLSDYRSLASENPPGDDRQAKRRKLGMTSCITNLFLSVPSFLAQMWPILSWGQAARLSSFAQLLLIDISIGLSLRLSLRAFPAPPCSILAQGSCWDK